MKMTASFALLAAVSLFAFACDVESTGGPVEDDEVLAPELDTEAVGIRNPECQPSDCNGAPIPDVPACPGGAPRFLVCAGTRPSCALYPVPCAGGETE